MAFNVCPPKVWSENPGAPVFFGIPRDDTPELHRYHGIFSNCNEVNPFALMEHSYLLAN